MSRMYRGVKSWNPFVGCEFYCIYCVRSFQRQAKRLKKKCSLCYAYKPHFHVERLERVPSAEVIFACAYGDVYWAKMEWAEAILDVVRAHPDKTFYFQSKKPSVFLTWQEFFGLPENIVLGTTVETDLEVFDVAGKTVEYSNISFAPPPAKRLKMLSSVEAERYVTVEPILDFSSPREFATAIEAIEPEFVYVGYDNHNCRLPEPPLHKTWELIDELEKFTEVRLKTVRKAWWEEDCKQVRDCFPLHPLPRRR